MRVMSWAWPHPPLGPLLAGMVFLLVLAQAATLAVSAKAISPFDEAAHYDYIVHLRNGNFPVPAGQRYSEDAVQQWACRPTDRAASLAPLCGVPNSATDPRVLFGGINYQARFGPVYYSIAAVGSSLVTLLGVQDFTAARLVSAFLYALGSALLAYVAIAMAHSAFAAVGAVVAASSTGLALSVGATISPEAMTFLFSAAVIGATLLARSWRGAVLLTVGVAAVAGLTKPNFVVIALLGSAFLLLRWVYGERRNGAPGIADVTRLAAAATAPVVASALASAGWATIAVAHNETGAAPDGGIHEAVHSTLGLVDRVAEHVWALLRPDGGTAPGVAFTVLDTPLLQTVGLAVVVATLGAAVAAWVWPMGEPRRSLLVLRGTSIALPVSATMLAAIFWVTMEGGHWPTSRYGLPFLAAASVGLGASVTRRGEAMAVAGGLAAWIIAWLAMAAP